MSSIGYYDPELVQEYDDQAAYYAWLSQNPACEEDCVEARAHYYRWEA